MKRIKYKVDNLPYQKNKYWIWKSHQNDSTYLPMSGWNAVAGPFPSKKEAKKIMLQKGLK